MPTKATKQWSTTKIAYEREDDLLTMGGLEPLSLDQNLVELQKVL